MRLKSLETNWLRNFDRTIPIPEFMWHPLSDAAGKYYPPMQFEMYDSSGRPVEMHNGVIVVDPEHETEIPKVIAHEWRHHWQWHHGLKYDSPKKNLFRTLNYDDAVLKYFATSKCEMGALRFGYKVAGVHEYWEELLFDYVKDLKPRKIWV